MIKSKRTRGRRYASIALQLVAGLLCALPAAAQLESDVGINPGAMGKEFMKYATSGLMLFLVLIIFLLIKRKLGGSSEKFEPVIGMTISDVGTLKQKGLLTEEESRAVRAAMARQLSKQLETKAKPAKGGGGAEALLMDPEIRRLEALAEEKAAAKQRSQAMGGAMGGLMERAQGGRIESNNAIGDVIGDDTGSYIAPTMAPAVHVLDELLDSADEEENIDSRQAAAAEKRSPVEPPRVAEDIVNAEKAVVPAPNDSSNPADDIQLPPDVMSMVQLGFITPEELENIKARARAKKRELGG